MGHKMDQADDVILNNINRADCYDPVSVANYVIALSRADKVRKYRKITLIKLIKLVYIAHGWTLYKYKRPLIDEAPEAWLYGPIIPSIYHAFKHYGNKPIKKLGNIVNFVTGEYERPPDIQDAKIQALLQKVWQQYKFFNAIDLADLTHMPHTAWYRLVDPKRGERRLKNEQLDNVAIREEFQYWAEEIALAFLDDL